jgi:hypothetical protein
VIARNNESWFWFGTANFFAGVVLGGLILGKERYDGE